jgi:protein-disulfide isomerase
VSRNVKISAALIGVFVAVVLVMILGPASDEEGDVPKIDAADALVVRDSSHRLGEAAADGKVTLVEFLDFECEACGAYFPYVEQLREKYAGKVTFVARYFPLSGHFNGERAARAAQAAAQQDRFEDMYEQLFTTQEAWGERQVPADDTFRGYAEQLGLDMARYDADYAAPATLDRIRVDQADGNALGVNSTPTFFLNGEKLENNGPDGLDAAISDALDQ